MRTACHQEFHNTTHTGLIDIAVKRKGSGHWYDDPMKIA